MGHWGEARNVVAAIKAHAPALVSAAANADLSLRSKAWNDKKITAHQGIIPTPNVSARPTLNANERAVYELVCSRYLMQFYPAFEYVQTKLELQIADEHFAASGRQVCKQGWKAVRNGRTNGRRASCRRDRPLPYC